MARQDSSSELAGRLGATLTPRMDHAGAPARAEQSSGLFDMGALYTEALGQVMRRARGEVHLAPLARAPRLPWPPPEPWVDAPRWPGSASAGHASAGLRARELDYDLAVPVDIVDGFTSPRPLGLGWFGVAVAWLATVTIGAILATTVPAHAFPRSSARTMVVATPAAPAVASDIASAPSPDTAWTAVPIAQPVQAARPERSIPAVLSVPAPVAPTPKAVSKPSVVPVVRQRPRLEAPAPPAPTVPAVAAAPASKPAPEKPRVAAPPVSTAGMSLDELIRHEVQAEAGKTRK
jgi:hypothetical protein